MTEKKLSEAMFGAGCFWGVQYNFDQLKGVIETEVGFSGGSTGSPQEAPTYEKVCSGTTGHAEVVRIKYDPDKISYDKLLEEFWKMHDPTTMNRQGPDIGSQYRSIIFYRDEDQKKIAENSKKELNESGKLENKVVTEILAFTPFYKAEEYHQKYFIKTGKKVC